MGTREGILSRRAAIFLFLILVVGGGLAIGFFTAPGEWYAGLQKPAFNPPNWIFGPVWTILYVFIAISGWRVWSRAADSAAMKIWIVQLILNFAWSPIFFAAHQTGAAFAIILAMLLSILLFIALAIRIDRLAAWLFVPYALWVALASLLNGAIWLLN